MRARSRPDDRVADAAQRRLEALVAELGGHPPSPQAEADQGAGASVGGSGAGDRAENDEAQSEGEELLGRHARRPLPSSRRAASWAGDRLPPGVAGIRLGLPHVAVLAVLLVLGLALAGWSYARATRGPVGAEEVAPPRPSGGVAVGVPTASPGPGATEPAGTGAGVPGPATPGPDPAAAPEVVVDVEGKVRRPGIAVLPAGSRVVDALEAAGGARPHADLQALNLARLLVDGEQLLVGVDPPGGVAAGALTGPSAGGGQVTGPGTASGAAPVTLVDLNTADQTALETLPGVGPVTATAILAWRTEHGAFTSVDELLEVSGIGDATLAEIAPHVTL